MAKEKKLPFPTKLRHAFFKGVWVFVKIFVVIVMKIGKALADLLKMSKTLGESLAEESKAAAKPKRGKTRYSPFIARKTASGSYEDFDESVNSKSQVILLFGKRGSGKSTLGFRLLENIATAANRPAFVMGVKQELLPKWIAEINSLNQVENKGIVLVDEGAVEFASRESMKGKNVTLGKLLATARHKDLTLVFITQNTGMIDRGVLNLADVVMAKEGSLLQKQMERPVIKSLVEKADKAIKTYPKEKRVCYVYIFSDDFEGLCETTPPSFWSQKLSKSHAK